VIRALVAYASTSGATRAVAETCAARLGPGASLFDLKSLADEGALPPAGPHDLLIAGTPTYGKGDWHTSWEARFDLMAPLFLSAGTVMLFGLGDARGHGKTFAGGLGVLADRVMALGVMPAGWVPAATYSFEASLALRGDHFPGLVLEYRRHRHAVPGKIEAWLETVASRSSRAA
jgi:flavodoxin I